MLMNQSSTVSRALNDLKNQDIHALVTSFIQSNLGQPLVQAVVSLLDRIATKDGLQRLISQLLSTLTDPHFHIGLVNALKAYIEAHPWATAFFIIGVILMVNPLAMAGFGSLGPVAGFLAAAWQSSVGGAVAAGSAFAILQSWGMLYSVAIPVVGTIIAAGSIVAATAGEHIKEAGRVIADAGGREFAATAGEQIKEAGYNAWVIANAGGREIKKWSKGKL